MPPRKVSFDDLDYRIVCELHRDSRAAASAIARRTNSNERTVRKRIERLVAEGAVRLTAILEPSVFGFRTAADIFLEADPAREAQILAALEHMPEITYIAFGQGSNEVSIEARFKDNDQLREFIRKTLPAVPGLTVTRYALVPRILRNIDEWLPPREAFPS